MNLVTVELSYVTKAKIKYTSISVVICKMEGI